MRLASAPSNGLRAPRFGALIAGLLFCVVASGQTVVTTPYSYSRTSSFTYRADGLLQTETIEPDTADNCLVTSYQYDDAGNRKSATTSNCAGASAAAAFAARTSRSDSLSYSVTVNGVSVSVPAGTFVREAFNALDQKEVRTTDPRFGVPISLTGPNALTTSWSLDNFGRTELETRADGTRTFRLSCFIADRVSNFSSNHTQCSTLYPGAPEAPDLAVAFEYTVLQNSAGQPIGPFTRVYVDRAGRKIRTATEAFDAPTQPEDYRVIVQDTDYDSFGNPVVATAPYFLGRNSSTTTGSGDVGLTRTDYDALRRPTAVYTSDPNGGAGSQAYGSRGSRVSARTLIAYAGPVTTTTNDKGHPRKEERNLLGKLLRVTDALGAQLVHQYDAFDNLVVTKDARNNQIKLSYDVRGRKLITNDPDAGVIHACYDALGQVKAQQNSNQRGGHAAGACPGSTGTGTTATVVTNWTTMAYDLLGRMTQRVEPEYVSTWTFDTCTKGVGKLCATTTSGSAGSPLSRKYVYDGVGRPVSVRTDVTSGPSFASAVSYDGNGRVASRKYPSGLSVSYAYTQRGYLASLTNQTALTVNPLPATPGGTPATSKSLPAGSVLWQALAINAWGRIERQQGSAGVIDAASFDPTTGRVQQLRSGKASAGEFVDLTYQWDSIGRLTSRTDANGAKDASGLQVLDSYGYDALGRLTSYSVSGGSVAGVVNRTVTLQYNAWGMLLYKSDVGNYAYPTQGEENGTPHAVKNLVGGSGAIFKYDWNGNAISSSAGSWRSITYTSFNLPDSQNGVKGPGTTPVSQYGWHYDENHQRIKETRTDASGARTTWTLHPDNAGGLGYECAELNASLCQSAQAQQRHYLSAGGAAVGVIVITGKAPTLQASDTEPPTLATATVTKLEHWHTDAQGSLAATSDHLGQVTARYAYDPFGKRRFTGAAFDGTNTLVVDWTTNTNNGTDRGYTGHEHLDDVGLVHMNGRIFDPRLGRFLQADPFIQNAGSLQNYDRYQYCFNTPITCVDPNGYIFKWIAEKWREEIWRTQTGRAVVAIVVAYFTYGIASEYLAFTAQVGATATTYGAAGIAGFAGGAVAGGTFKSGLQGALTAMVFAGVGDYIQGDTAFGGAPGVADATAQVALHGVAGCVTSAAGGGKCGPGALSAAFSKTLAINGVTGGRDPITGTIISAVAGGTASVIGGGKFANGAFTGAFSYLFNYLMHVHRALSMHAAARSGLGLTYDEVDRLARRVVGVDFLPGSQDADHAYMHAMCTGGVSPAECFRATDRYSEKMWQSKSVDGLAGLLHLDQDSYAPKHTGGQAYSGFASNWDAMAHGWSDRMPPSDIRMQLIERSSVLIRNYDAYCGGCVKSGLSGSW